MTQHDQVPLLETATVFHGQRHQTHSLHLDLILGARDSSAMCLSHHPTGRERASP